MADEPEKTPKRISAGMLKWLLAELPAWVEEGLLSADSAKTIGERYSKAQAQKGRTQLITIFGIIAALLLGTGVILFFASNWEGISRFGKLAIICLALALSYLGAYELKYRHGYEIIGDAIILLGTILFGSGIYLVAQAFNIDEHFPNGALLWMIGIAPMAIVIRSKPILALVSVLFCVWLGLEAEIAEHAYFEMLQTRAFLALPLFAGIVAMTYAFGGKINAFIIIGGLVTWTIIAIMALFSDYDAFDSAHAYLTFYGLAVFVGGLGSLHRQKTNWPKFGATYRTLGLIALIFLIFLLTFHELGDELTENGPSYIPGIFALVYLIAGMIFSVASLQSSDRESNPFAAGEAYIFLAAGMLGFLLFFIFSGSHVGGFVAFVANLALLGMIISLIVIGSRAGLAGLVNLGILAFGIDFISRYFEFFWDLFSRSLFFIAGGIIMLVAGIWLEKRRKQWIKEAKEGTVNEAGN